MAAADDFYLFLMSNTESNNRIGDFRVRLAHPVRLDGKYEVALTDLVYPFTFDNLSDRAEGGGFHENSLLIHRPAGGAPDNRSAGSRVEVRVPTHNYATGAQLVELVNHGVAQAFRDVSYRETNRQSSTVEAAAPSIFHFNPVTGKCSSFFDTRYSFIELSSRLAYLLGFDSRKLEKGLHEARHPVHVGNELMFIYSDLVDFQMLSNVMAPLLKIVNMKGTCGQSSEVSFARPHYVPLLKNSFDSVCVQLKNDLDEVINFYSGKVAMTLHVRRRRAHY
jgi:hypothetical protein